MSLPHLQEALEKEGRIILAAIHLNLSRFKVLQLLHDYDVHRTTLISARVHGRIPQPYCNATVTCDKEHKNFAHAIL